AKQFDPAFFGILPVDAVKIDPQERRLLTMTYHALEDAAYFASPSTDIGVFVAVMYAHYQNLQGRSNTINSSFASVANRISYTFNFHGPSLSLDTMCSGSLSALHFAVNNIRNGECRQAIVGAANVMSHPGKYRVLSEGRFLSPTGRCHSFGIEADGYVPGEGAIAIIIKPLRDALENQDRIHGIIRASALNSSGRSSSFTVPSSRAQEEVIKTALRAADIGFEDVDYVEAHGTGTSLGDPIEIQALTAACGSARKSACFVGSIKSNIGHLESAAGLAGLTKILLQFQKGKIAPTINCAIENPHLNLNATMFRLPHKISAWPAKQGRRFAALSSFGAGGSNGHAVLQEYAASRTKNLPHRQQYLVPISGKTQDELNRRVSELAQWLEGNADIPAYSIGYTLSIGREHFRCRACFVVETARDLRDQLVAFGKTGMAPVLDQLDPQLSGIRATYLANGNAPFQELYPIRDVISLPGYPFEQQEYWDSEIAQQWSGSDSPAASRQSTAFLAFQPAWEAAPLSRGAADTSSRCIVICDPQQVSELESCAGVMVLTCGERYSIRQKSIVVRPDSLEDCIAALQYLLGSDRSGKVDIVNLLRSQSVQHRGSPAQPQFQFNLAKAILGHGGQFRVISVYEAGGSDLEPIAGAMSQLFRVVAMEEKCIQFFCMEADEVLFKDARKLLDHAKEELDSSGPEFRACRRTHDSRFVYKLHEVAVHGSPARRFKQQGVYLITGGLGMIGSAVAQKLLTDLNANVVLVGRSPRNDGIEEKIRRLQARGGKLDYISADINDEGSVERLVQSIRTRYGNLNGVIHCAGILKDTLFRNKSWPEFEEVVGVKLRGAQNLDRATKDLDLDFFVLFSSMSSIFGNVGQADYVVGNSFLDFFAEARMRRVKLGMCHGLSLSINWPLWFDDPSGKDDSMAAYRSLGRYLFDTYGLGSLAIEDGVAIFMQLVDSLPISVSQITPLTGDFSKIRRSVVSGILGPAGERHANVLQSEVASTSDPRPLTAALCSIASELSGLPQNGISLSAGFGDLGFSSVMLQQLAVRIEREFGVSMPPSAFFSYHSIEKLAGYLAGRGVHIRDQVSPHVPVDAAKLEPLRPAQSSSSNSSFLNHSATARESADENRIAIIGIDGRLPGGCDLQEFWRGLVNNASAIQEMKRWPHKRSFAGVIPDIEQFDAKFFGMSAREAMLMDPQHRLFLQASYNAMMDSGYAPRELSRAGVFAGVQFSDYQSLLHTSRQGSHPYAATGNAHAMLANRVSYTFDFHGPSETIDTACSSALVAVHRAVSSLARRECDFAIAGAVSLLLDSTITDAAESMGILSPNHRCATFDAEADGYVRSEGVGCIVLKRLSDALADGDSIYAIIESVAENHGGRASSLTAPNPEAQKRLLMAAYTPELAQRVTYIETHGTGTKLGDPVEIDGLKSAWKDLLGELGS
ncbi:MAG TPA: SDR family NAD(P)-dependent oxidoreductase, partial [Candidatus Angelobacter sp.]|nr:SDR family NAD(P)-dependent oxidoreductase [Candidatus Angelobacter sp.]